MNTAPLRRAAYFPLLAYFSAGVVVANLVCLGVAAARPPGAAREALCRRIIGAMTSHFLRLCARACGFVVVDETGGIRDGLRGAVIAANHPSLIDAPVLFSTDGELVCFYKAGLRKSMLGLPCARHSGFIANDAGIGGLLSASHHLAAGRNVLVFPESTRTGGDEGLDAFKRSAALLAIRAHAPVVCLTLRYDSPFLGKSSRMFRAPALPLRLRVGHAATLNPDDFPDAAALNTAMRLHIERGLRA